MRRLLLKIRLKLRRKKRPEAIYYDDFTKIPIKIWRQVNDTGDLKYLCRSGKPTAKALKKAYHKLNNYYLKNYALTFKLKRILEQRKRLAVALVNYLATGDKRYEMEADLIEIDIKNENKGGKATKFNDITINIEKYYGFAIDEDNTSADKFYSYLKVMELASDKMKELKGLKNG